MFTTPPDPEDDRGECAVRWSMRNQKRTVKVELVKRTRYPLGIMKC